MRWTPVQKKLLTNTIAIFVIALVAIAGVKLFNLSHAATVGATLTLSPQKIDPGSTALKAGDPLVVDVMVGSGSDQINSVEAKLSYDPTQLKLDTTAYTNGTAFPIPSRSVTTPAGTIDLVRSIRGGSTSGTNKVVTLNFHVVATTTTAAALNFDEAGSRIFKIPDASNPDVTNILLAGGTTSGSYAIAGATAAASGALSLTSVSAVAGSTVSIALHEDGGTDAIKQVTGKITYDTAQFDTVSISNGTAFPTIVGTDTNTSGVVVVTRAVASGTSGISGDNVVATINLHIKASAGTTANLSILKAESSMTRTSDGSNVLRSVTGGSVMVTAPSTGNNAIITMSPSKGNYVKDSIITVTATVNSGSDTISVVDTAFTYPAALLEFVPPTSAAPNPVLTTSGLLIPLETTVGGGTGHIAQEIEGGSGGVSGTNQLFTMKFKVLAAGSAEVRLTPDSDVYKLSDATNILDLSNPLVASYTLQNPAANCTTNPTAPSGVSKTAADYTSISLSWTASTPGANCRLGGYKVIRDGAVVQNVTGTTFTDSGLIAGAIYNYVIQAYDNASPAHTASSSGYNAGTNRDNVAPTTPTGFMSPARSAASVSLSWNPSADMPNPGGVGVAGYHIYRGSAITPTYTVTTGTTYTDSNVSASTSYTYKVAAYDKNDNESSKTSILTVRTDDPTCTGNPSIPASLTQTARTLTSVTIAWAASTPSAGCTIAGYHVYNGTNLVDTVTGTNLTQDGLTPNTNYTYTVKAYDTSSHTSASSTALTANTAADVDIPSVPGNVTATATAGQVKITWTAATDNVAVTGYRLYKDSSLFKTVGATILAYTDTLVAANTDYRYKVSAIDAAGHESAQVVTTPDPVRTPSSTDNQVPTTPSGLKTTGVSPTSIALSWTASTDNVGVVGYHIYRGGSYLADSSTPDYIDDGLTPETSYTYRVEAFDGAFNKSSKSSPVTATTLKQPSDVLIGDLDNDRDVDDDDLVIFLDDYGKAPAPGRKGDLNGDTYVDDDDLTMLLENYGVKLL